MKKLGIIVVLVLCSLKMVAQLQNTVLGCTLGITSENGVINTLRQRGYNPQYHLSVLFINNPSFGSIKWATACFYFKNDKLSEVRLIIDYKTASISTLQNTYDYISSLLTEKYGTYKNNEQNNVTSFSDNKIGISIYFQNDDCPGTVLQYVYVPFIQENRRNGFNEL